MSKEIPSQYNPKEVEDKIYRIWEESGYFAPDKIRSDTEKNIDRYGKKRPRKSVLSPRSFCVVLPPPNITGSLHMGHALNVAIQDILIRKKRMEGYRTLWLPGTDHAGIATQNVVEKDLKKQGVSRYQLGREEFLEKVWEWKEKYGNIISDQLKKIGASCDWSRTRFTMDEGYQKAVEEAFLRYYKKGWIYRAERVVNWCGRCATSLSDLELEYKENKGKLYYIKYPLAGGGDFIVVATTRPETMLGDTAVAVNPSDKRYAKFIGKEAVLPIQNRKIPIVADKAVDMKFGTGAIKVTPAHDLLDAEIAERHNLPMVKVIGPDGKMTIEAGAICEGATAGDCRTKVVEELTKQKLLEREELYIHSIAVCYRCGTIIEPMPSLQWFLKMDKLAKLAIQAVKSGKVKFHPKRWEKTYFDWLKNIRDWNISRQIWWGHQLPVYKKREENLNPKSEILNNSKNFQRLEIRNSDLEIYVGNNPPEGYTQILDVLDTWFSSALWPFATLGWPLDSARGKPSKNSDLEKYYPTQVLSTARDIINLWVARMIFSGAEFMKKEPFSDVIIHATILTKDGKRMSKSLGTGIDPMDLIEKYGADATRFGLIWQAMGNQDMHWSEEHVVAGKKFCNKIWNSARFLLMQLSDFQPRNLNKPLSKTAEDKKIIAALEKIKKEANKRLEKYEFGKALHGLYDFFWHDFCDKYIETSKGQMADGKLKENTQEILLYVLAESLKLLHPFMPFITEEIWGHLPIKSKSLLIIEKWPK